MSKKKDSVVMWFGLGVVSPKGMYLEAYGRVNDFIVKKLRANPTWPYRGAKKRKLVMVVARLEEVTERQALEAAGIRFGFQSPPPRRRSAGGKKPAYPVHTLHHFNRRTKQ